jgi:hypothetical protein
MSIAEFTLVKKVPLLLTRSSGPGHHEDGEWIPGETSEITIQANVQPFSDYQVMILPESDRTKNWVWVFSATTMFQKKEGSVAREGDKFRWNGEWYEIMKTQTFQMGVRDHTEAKAARIEISPS